MVDPPRTRYAKAPGGNVAYQVVGDGPRDLVVVPGWFSHLDLQWENPPWRAFIMELASFTRLVLYDKRGTGLSDPVDGAPTLESRADDLLAVIDAAGSTRPALFGFSEGGPISLLFAGTYPERVSSLILYGTGAIPPDPEVRARIAELILQEGDQSTTGARERPSIGRRHRCVTTHRNGGGSGRWNVLL